MKSYFSPYYDSYYYKTIENAFNGSQYRVKEKPGIMPDNTLFSFAAGYLLRGGDPILVNSEITPLGKYFIALSILFTKNPNVVIVIFFFLTLFLLWLLGTRVLDDYLLAMIPVTIFAFEKLFLNQLRVSPLLDVIQLPFILMALYAFLIEKRKKTFFFTALVLGLVAVTKSIVPATLLAFSFLIFLLLKRQAKSIRFFLLALPIGAIVFTASYLKTFLNGYTFLDFIGFQKWIFLYQQSKLIFPLSFWNLVLFNRWQSWWGDMRILKAEDWQITWPLFSLLPFFLVVPVLTKKKKISDEALVLLIWIFVYETFLSLGVVSSRFLLPLLPPLFVIGIYFLRGIFTHLFTKKKIASVLFLLCFLPLFIASLSSCAIASGSDYVLPYPSYMPGNALYRIHGLWEKFQEYWHFGNLAKFTYNLSAADSYLVEGKTLFEYNQYLLASQSIVNYENHLYTAKYYLLRAQREGKDISAKRQLLTSAITKHKEVLEKLRKELPAQFDWREEKKQPTVIEIHKILDGAMGSGRQTIEAI